MPELPEVEGFRQLAEKAVGRKIDGIVADDVWYLKRGATPLLLKKALAKHEFTGTRRVGKLLMLDIDTGDVLGLRFGMSGRLFVDGIDRRGHNLDPQREKWDRFVVHFKDGGDLRMRDARRLGGVELLPRDDQLGPDAPELTLDHLRISLQRSPAPVKARVMNQHVVAGVGNLLADEIFWRAGIDPGRESRSLDDGELSRLHTSIVATVQDLMITGSHSGEVHPHRQAGGRCPLDGAELIRRTIGGRTTWSCPQHQT